MFNYNVKWGASLTNHYYKLFFLVSYRLIDSITITCTEFCYFNKAITTESCLAFLRHCSSCFLGSHNPTILVMQTDFCLGYLERCFVPCYWKKKVDSYCVSNIPPNFWGEKKLVLYSLPILNGTKTSDFVHAHLFHNRNVCT